MRTLLAAHLLPYLVRALRLPAAHAAGMGERVRAAAARFAWDLVVDRVERVYRETATSEARR